MSFLVGKPNLKFPELEVSLFGGKRYLSALRAMTFLLYLVSNPVLFCSILIVSFFVVLIFIFTFFAIWETIYKNIISAVLDHNEKFKVLYNRKDLIFRGSEIKVRFPANWTLPEKISFDGVLIETPSLCKKTKFSFFIRALGSFIFIVGVQVLSSFLILKKYGKAPDGALPAANLIAFLGLFLVLIALLLSAASFHFLIILELKQTIDILNVNLKGGRPLSIKKGIFFGLIFEVEEFPQPPGDSPKDKGLPTYYDGG